MSKKWTDVELFFLNCGKFDVKYLKLPKNLTIKLLQTLVLRNRTVEAIRKKLNNV